MKKRLVLIKMGGSLITDKAKSLILAYTDTALVPARRRPSNPTT